MTRGTGGGAVLAGLLALFACAATPASARMRDAESIAQRDARLLAEAVAGLEPQRAGVIDLYAIGFAGDGTEDVFRNEVAYFPLLARQRLRARGVLALVSHPDSLEASALPLANYDNLQQALRGVAGRMDPEEDILLLYLTMHGTPEHELALYFPPFVEDALLPEDLRTLLDESGIRNRVLVISACYSGGFIPELRGPDTLLVTASRQDRASFGCGSQSSLTWFGRAWMVEGLNRTQSFVDAYEYATRRVRDREQAEDVEASFPQMSMGRDIRERLKRWRAQAAWGEPVPDPYPIEESGLVELLAAREHGDVLLDPHAPGIGLDRGVHAEAEGVSVGPVERVEERGRLAVLRQRGGEFGGDLHARGAVVRGLPAAVGHGRLDLAQARRTHAPGVDQALDPGDVGLRPQAARLARGEALQEERLVQAAAQAVDPAVAERDLDGLLVAHRDHPAALLADLQPRAAFALMPGQPAIPGRGIAELPDREPVGKLHGAASSSR